MRILFIIAAIFFIGPSSDNASSLITGKVEKIDVNLKDHELAVTFIGLSNGEAILIQGNNGENILVNAGAESGELEEILKLYRVKEIRTLIMTSSDYPSPEHLNHLISTYTIRELVTTPSISSKLTKIIDPSYDINVLSWDEGTRKILFPDLTLVVQYAGIGENEGLDFTLQFYQHRLFFMTSSSKNVEKILLNKELSDVTIFKVPKWGNEDSLSEKLIQFINPQISIVFESDKNNPDPDILYDLHDTWSELYFTKRNGPVTIKFTETNYEIFTILIEKED